MTQVTPWLHIVGIGEDGLDGLTPVTRAVVDAADVIVGGKRHHELVASGAERLAWPSPFDALIAELEARRGKLVVVLASGDPLWFSVGAKIGRHLDPQEITYHPQIGAFQLAAARMGWSMADLETLTVHGRPVEQMIAFIQPDVRLLILTTGAETPGQIAAFLSERGFGKSRMTVLAHMGGGDEARFDGLAEDWAHDVPAFNTLAVECIAAPDAPRADRRALAAANALALGVPRLELVDGMVPDALDALEAPDAVFIGGGLSEETFDAAWSALRPLGRLVANAVTLESEMCLAGLHKKHGGQLIKLSVERVEPLGPHSGWKPLRPVTQWSLIKR